MDNIRNTGTGDDNRDLPQFGVAGGMRDSTTLGGGDTLGGTRTAGTTGGSSDASGATELGDMGGTTGTGVAGSLSNTEYTGNAAPMGDSAMSGSFTDGGMGREGDMNGSDGWSLARAISPTQHAVLDYTVAGTFLAMGLKYREHNRAAANLAFLNAAMVAGMSMMTDYPGGMTRRLSFRGHRTGDMVQAALAGLGPMLFGFSRTPEAKFFYGQALSEVGVIAATDWDRNE